MKKLVLIFAMSLAPNAHATWFYCGAITSDGSSVRVKVQAPNVDAALAQIFSAYPRTGKTSCFNWVGQVTPTVETVSFEIDED